MTDRPDTPARAVPSEAARRAACEAYSAHRSPTTLGPTDCDGSAMLHALRAAYAVDGLAAGGWKHDCNHWRMEGIACANCNPIARELADAGIGPEVRSEGEAGPERGRSMSAQAQTRRDPQSATTLDPQSSSDQQRKFANQAKPSGPPKDAPPVILDIAEMPRRDPKVTNGIRSVSEGKVTWGVPIPGNAPWWTMETVICRKHGAMLRVGEKLWRCPVCNEGAYTPNGVVHRLAAPTAEREALERLAEKWERWAEGEPDERVKGALEDCAAELRAAVPDAGLREKYYELLYAVATKHPDESRHETALRYIRNAERGGDHVSRAALAQEGE